MRKKRDEIDKINEKIGFGKPNLLDCIILIIYEEKDKIIFIIKTIKKIFLFSYECSTLLPAGPTRGRIMHIIKKPKDDKIVSTNPANGSKYNFFKYIILNYCF